MLTRQQLDQRIYSLVGQTVYTIERREPNTITSVVGERVLLQKGTQNRPSIPTLGQIWEVYRLLHREGYCAMGNLPGELFDHRVARVIMAILAAAVPEETITRQRFESPTGHSGIWLRQ